MSRVDITSFTDGISQLAWSPDQDVLLSSSWDCALRCHAGDTGAALAESSRHATPLLACAFVHGATVLAGAADGALLMADLEHSPQLTAVGKHEGGAGIPCLEYHRDLQLASTAGTYYIRCIYTHVRTLRPFSSLSLSCAYFCFYHERFHCVCKASPSHHLALCTRPPSSAPHLRSPIPAHIHKYVGWDGALRFWDVRSAQCVLSAALPGKAYAMSTAHGRAVVVTAGGALALFSLQQLSQVSFKTVAFALYNFNGTYTLSECISFNDP
jgi:WD40 repeat protein